MQSAISCEKFRILICGAGIGGLALAHALIKYHKDEIHFDIIERDESMSTRCQGYSLTVQQNGQRVLKELGIYEEFEKNEHVCWGRGQTLIQPDGKIIKLAQLSTKKKSDLNAYIPRSELRKILIHTLPKTTQIQWGVWVHDFHKNPDGTITALLENINLKQTYDLVVSSEGIFSKIRDALIGDPLIYLGVGMTNGIVEIDETVIENNHSYSIMGDGVSRLFFKPYSPGHMMWQLTTLMDEKKNLQLSKSDKDTILKHSVSILGDWKHPIIDYIQKTELERLRCGPLYGRNPLTEESIKKNGRFFLIGDSCHPMPPFQGQGANQALEDALFFAQNFQILKSQELEKELLILQEQCIQRASKVQLASMELVQIIHSDQVKSTYGGQAN